MPGDAHRTHDTDPEVKSGKGWTSQIDPELDPELTERVGPAPRPLLENGAIVDRYVILSHLGSGGMGAVYAAWDQKLARRVALKLLHGDRRRGQEGAWRLQREARALARLDHDNVVRVFDVGTWGDAPYITMELVDGAGLDVSLADKRLSKAQILSACIAAGRGLASAHRLGVVHRDVKAQNIFVGVDGRARIGDFGIAIVVGDTDDDPSRSGELPPGLMVDRDDSESATVAGAILGTPAYMAPEHAEGKKVDARADVFSFCVTLWRAVFDEDPFGAPPNTLARRDQIKAGPLKPKRRDPALEAVLAKGLRFRVKERTPSMAVLLAELEWLAGRGRRRRLLATAAVVVVVVVASAVVVARRDPCGVHAKSEALAAALSSGSSSPALRAVIERWRNRWQQSASGTCGRADLDDDARAERTRCYDASLKDVTALLSLRQRDVINDDAALQAALSLPLPERCLDGRQQVSTDETRVAALALARMALLAGETSRAAAEARVVLDGAAGRHNDVIAAEAAVVLGKAQSLMGSFADAEATVRTGLAAAMRAMVPRVEAELWMALVDVVGDKLKRHDDVNATLPLMRAAVARFPEDVDLQASALVTEALIANEFGDKSLGLQRATEALAMAKLRDPIDPHIVADAVNLQSLMAGMLGDTRRAVDVIEAGRALMLKHLPPTHIRFMSMNNSLGLAQLRAGDLAGARAAFEASIAVATAQARPADFDAMRGVPMNNIARVDLIEGHVARAIEAAQAARAVLVASAGEDNARVAYADEVLAYAAMIEGRVDDALAHAGTMVARTKGTPGIWLGVRGAILVASIRAEASGDVVSARLSVEALRPENAQGRASQDAAIAALLAAAGDADGARQALDRVLTPAALAVLSIEERQLTEAIDAQLREKDALFPIHMPLARLAMKGLGVTVP